MAALEEAQTKYVYSPRPPLNIDFTAPDKNYNMVSFRGVPQNPTFRVEELENLVSTFETAPGDVFICTYPKCGTTWMQQICHLLVNGGEQGSSNMYATAPWLECLCAAPILHEREANCYTLEQLSAKSAPRFFKSHANFKDLPRGKNPEGVKTIVVSRNPKDTCVSMWHHAREKPEFNLNGGAPRPGSDDPPAPIEVCPDFEDFVKLFLSGQAECGSWFNHTLEWYAASLTDPNILFLKYEDMIDDPKRCISEVAAFIGVGNDEVTIDKTVVNSSMKNMKKSSGVYAGNVRKGGVGNWRNKIPENSCVNAMFDGEYYKQMRGTGLEFDFGDGLVM
jgi:hypothetical protein